MELSLLKQFFSQKPVMPGICGINIQPEGIALAHVVWETPKQPRLLFAEFIPCNATPKELLETLKSVVDRHQLQGTECSWVLHPDSYKLLSIEPLPVEKEEMTAALQWRLKDMVNFPIAEAAIDYFEIPIPAPKSTKNMLQVVVARKADLITITDVIRQSGLSLSSIDIPELAFRNIAKLYSEDERGMGLVVLKPNNSEFIITHHAHLYLTRTLDLTLTSFFEVAEIHEELNDEKRALLDKLALQLQRSVDYYQSQLHQVPPGRIFISSANPAIVSYLAPQLACEVRMLELPHTLTPHGALTDELQDSCLAAIGGALRAQGSV